MPNPIRFYTTEALGPKRHWTPEGFLLCSSVPIARVGTLIYAAGEIPVPANQDGLIRIIRDPSEVFHPNAILSFAGKPVTDEHPPSKVTPDNWKAHAIGVVLNPHQGDGHTEDNSLLYADLLIQDRQAIKDVLEGKREVSAGYDAEYEPIRPGEGKQHNIIGNHVALVQRGRCGPVCSIGDSAMATTNRRTMTVDARRRQAFRDRIMTAFATGDEEALVDELDKVDDMMGNVSTGGPVDVGSKGAGGTGDEMGGIHVHLHNSEASPTGQAPAPTQMDAPPPGGGGNVPPAAAAPAPGGGSAPDGGGGVTLQQLAARVEQLEQAVAILAQGEDDGGGAGAEGGEPPDENSPGESASPPDAKPPTGDRRMTGDRSHRATVGDSTSMRLMFNEAVARAELLAPGMRHPTFDSAKPAKVTAETLCDLRRRTLDSALAKNDDAKDAVLMVAGKPRDPGKHFKQMSCDAISAVFNGASEMVRTSGIRGNSSGAPAAGRNYGNSGAVLGVAETVANINRVNREKWGITK